VRDFGIDPDAEQRLAAAFDRAVDVLAAGGELSLDELAQGCEELRPQLAEILRLAREVAVRPSETAPKVPGFELERELGRGGMGTVFLARQSRVGGRRVALKVLPQLAAGSSRSRERFATEVRALSKLAHPGVVAIHDVVLERDVCAYAMEWIDGSSLAEQIRAGAFGVERAAQVCELALAIARALHAAHQVGVIHRDVKPSNILLRRDGTALLADFGLARDDESASASRSGGFVGTPAYAAPEQLRGESSAIDARTDVYALGATIYHALIGRPPHDGRTGEQLLRQIERGARRSLRSVDPRLSRELETIVDKCLEGDAAQRYASAAELADDLERLLKLQPIRARPAGWLARISKVMRRNRATAWGAFVGGLVSLAAAAAVVTYVFFVPRWVEEHVREARLALLDPRAANAVFLSAAWGAGDESIAAFVGSEQMLEALHEYDAALRWTPFDTDLREEREVVASVLGARVASPTHWSLRSQGLAAFLECRIDAALAAWSACEQMRAASAAPDPLLEAGLGLLHLVRDEPSRAYPRLREATQVFPDVGFLATYLADAALRCGDLAVAERTLERASRLPHLDPQGGFDRVRADWLAAAGRDDQAQACYRQLQPSPVAMLHFARFLDARGRRDEAVTELARLPDYRYSARLAQEMAGMFERWWAELDREQRCRSIAGALDLAPTNPASLAQRCRVYANLRAAAGENSAPSSPPMNQPGWFSSPPLESLGLPEVAEVLEVDDMQRWALVPSYSNALKSLQLLAWRTPARALIAPVIERMHENAVRLISAASLVTLGAQANAQCSLSYDAASGLLPSGCWSIVSVGTPPPPTVSNGELSLGPTSGQDLLYLQARDTTIDFAGGFSCEARFEVTAADCAFGPSSWPRHGLQFVSVDRFGRMLYVCMCDTNVVLGNTFYQPVDGVNVKSAPIAAVGGLLDLRVQTSAMGHELWINSALVATVSLGPLGASGASSFYVGDGTSHGNSEWSLRSIILSGACPPPQAYCTAGTTSSGCNASMSSSGTPSVAATSGFTLTCSNVEGQKFGLIFYGVNGPVASVWAPGNTSFLCVKSPVQRTGSANSGGTAGACNGAYSLDFLTYLSTHPGALGQPFAAGDCVNTQTWFRDPAAPGTTNLSNGLQFVTTP